ncbi:MAG: protein translocase subunit SecDF, partial [Alistipes sp.]|nr:protein translocase subunit SecDF [Alistipes sp.]
MQSKGVIKWVAILMGLACLYQLSFTWKTSSVEKAAVEYAKSFPAEEQASMEQYYLDSIENKTVYNVGLTSFTYKQCKEKEINLGLDLKGGMNVMLEIQVEDVVKSLAGESQHDPNFVIAIAEANEALRQGTGGYIETLAEAYAKASNGAPLADLFVSPDRKDIKAGMSDAEVVKVLKQETDDALAASFNIIRSRIDHFGVVQPNIQRLPNSNRILVELPGVKEPERVRKLLQGTASLEFWTTYNGQELLPALQRADMIVKAYKDEHKEAEVKAETATDAPALAAEVSEEAKAEEAAARFSRERNPLLALLNPGYAGGAVIGAATAADTVAINKYLAMPEVRDCFPSDVRFKWGIKGDKLADGQFFLYAIKVERADGKAPLDGSVISDARATYAQTGANAEVSMAMNSNGITE